MIRLFLISVLLTLTSCNNTKTQLSDTESQKITDIDTTKKYADTVIIKNQIWTTKNLNVDKFQNGDPIFGAKTIEEFKKAGAEGKPAWCYYNNDKSNEKKYGKLYNWYAVDDARGLAPIGWHIPSIKEWDTLTISLGGEDVCGQKLRYTSGWYTTGNGDNTSGFSALPGGYFMDYDFNSVGELGFWWTATQCYKGAAYGRYLNYNYAPLKFASFSSGTGFSVRCVKD